MQLIVYIALFIIFSPRYFFSFMKSSSGRIGFKEVVSHAAVFGFAVVVMQWVSKRYGVFEGFNTNPPMPPQIQEVMNTINNMAANGNGAKKPTA